MRKLKKIFFILVLLTITGCGRKEVDYSVGDTSDNAGGYSDISMDTISEKIGVEEEWEETIDEASGKKIYAAVTVPEVTGMKVVDVEYVNYLEDPEAKESFIRAITSGEVYWYGDDYQIKEDYDWHIASVQAYIDYWDEDEGIDDAVYDAQIETLDRLEEERENSPETYVHAENFDENCYIIDYNGIDYKIEFSSYSDRTEVIHFIPRKMEDLVDMENINLSLYESDIYPGIENKCTMTEEEARQEALEFINNLNVGEFSCVDTNALKYCIYTNSNSYEVIITSSTEQIEYYDGYSFRFVRSIDGINVDGNYYDYRYTETYNNQLLEVVDSNENYSWIPESYMEEIIIQINDKGVVYMSYSSPLKITAVNAENVNLLSFDRVKNSISYEIDAKEYYKHKTFRYLELCYFNYYDKEQNKNCIIPVWRLTDKSMDSILNNEIYSYVVINAMDGSVINVAEQITTFEEYE